MLVDRNLRMSETAMTKACIVFMVALVFSTTALAQATGRVTTPTRTVTKYSELERTLAEAIQSKNEAGIGKYLADDFEVWMPQQSGAVPREDWIRGWAKGSLSQFQPHDMAVRTFDSLEIASFVAEQKGTFNDRNVSGRYFVVDVWRQLGNEWKLAVRYQSRTSVTPAQHRRPTGKE